MSISSATGLPGALSRSERTRSMKILHFKMTMRLEEGGVVKAVLDLMSMGMRSDEIGLVTTNPSGVPDAWSAGSELPVHIHQLSGASGPAGTLTKAQLREIESVMSNYDVVHLHSMWGMANPQVVKVCNRLGKPYVLSVHGMLDDWCMTQRRPKKVLFLKTWARNLLRDAGVIHCTAQAELDQASKWFDPSKGMVAPLPFDLDEYADLPDESLAYETFPRLDRERPKAIFLSRINYKKGVDRLIEASALLHESGFDHQLIIAGTGEDDYVASMHELAEKRGIKESTYFAGFASGEPKVALLRAADLFVLPTSQENFGFVYFESLGAGTPVLTTKCTDTWPELESSGAGIIVDNTPRAFADAMREHLSDTPRLREMGQQGRDWTFSTFRPEAVSDSIRAMYTRAMGGSS